MNPPAIHPGHSSISGVLIVVTRRQAQVETQLAEGFSGVLLVTEATLLLYFHRAIRVFESQTVHLPVFQQAAKIPAFQNLTGLLSVLWVQAGKNIQPRCQSPQVQCGNADTGL